MDARHFSDPLAYRVWASRYRWHEQAKVCDRSIEDTWRRAARALASPELKDAALWEKRFCGILEALKEGALTMQLGGGIGCDFSTMRPSGDIAGGTHRIASGPVPFMRLWDRMCATVLGTSARRGAMMATLSCDHSDIERFVEAKADGAELRHFNLSVLVSDAFMDAVAADADWPLVFPCGLSLDAVGTTDDALLPHAEEPPHSRIYRHVSARKLWRAIMRANYDYAEPGVIFIDRVQALNNLRYCEEIRATNPCGEIPLPGYGACDLGSLNLTQFVQAPFTPRAKVDWSALRGTTEVAVRMLDNVYEVSEFPLRNQRDFQAGRRARSVRVRPFQPAVRNGLRSWAERLYDDSAERGDRVRAHAASEQRYLLRKAGRLKPHAE